jgi:hypothetical protein
MTEIVKEQAKAAFSNALTVGKKYAEELAASEDFFKPIVLAMAIQELKLALTPEAMSAIQALEGSALGFKTDLQNSKYDVNVIKDCVIEAMLRGVGVAGNQFNIIKGQFYIARNGWEAKLRKSGCTEIVPTAGRPEDVLMGAANQNGNRQITATIAAHASCMKDGTKYSVSAANIDGVDGRFEVTGFGKDLTAVLDQLKGKAEARILKKLYCRACDANEPEDGESASVIVVEQPVSPAITNDTAEREITQLQRDRIAAEFELASCGKMIANNVDHVDFFEQSVQGINESDSVELLGEVGKLMKEKNTTLKLSERIMKELRRLYEIRKRELSEVAS